MNKIKEFKKSIEKIEKPLRLKAFYQSLFVSFLLWLVLALMLFNLYIFIEYLFLISTLLCLVSTLAFLLNQIIYYRLLGINKGEINFFLIVIRTAIFALFVTVTIISITLWVSRLL